MFQITRCACGAPLAPKGNMWICSAECRPPPQPQVFCQCGKPTWDGKAGFCSIECKEVPQPQALCTCGRPTSDGNPGYCSLQCAPHHGQSLCSCGQPTWNGKCVFCSRACESQTPAQAPFGMLPGPACCRPGCMNVAWDQKLGGFCSKVCAGMVAAGTPVSTPLFARCANPACPCSTSWTGKKGDFCSKRCKAGTPCKSNIHRQPTHPSLAMPPAVGGGGPPAPPQLLPKPHGPKFARKLMASMFGSKVEAFQGEGSEKADRAARGFREVNPMKFQEIKKQFEGGFKQGTPPQIDKIYDVHNVDRMGAHETYAMSIGNVPLHGHGVNPGNKQRRFHQSTTMCNFAGNTCKNARCATCSILKTGFDVKYATTGRFGKGIYSTATSHKAHAYGNKKAMFVVGVCVGIPELSDSNGALAAGKHSRVVRPQQGAKANENDDECVVFQSNAIIAKYLIVFK